MITLFNISQEQQRINYLLEESGGELTPEIQEAMEINSDNFLVKSENYGKTILHYKAMEQVVASEMDRLAKIKKTIQNTQDRLKESISGAMILFDKEKLEFDTIKLSFRKSTQLVISDNANIPSEFIKVKTEVDKMALKEALKSREIEGVSIQENLNLQVK